MPRNLCSPRLDRPLTLPRLPARLPSPASLSVAQQLARQRAQANRWTLVLAGLSIACATAEAWWMTGLGG